MPIYMSVRFSVKPESLVISKRAIEAFMAYIRENELGTQPYTSLQGSENETDFLHYFIFDDAAEEKHHTAEGVKRFTSTLYAELSSDGVEFKSYTLAASTK